MPNQDPSLSKQAQSAARPAPTAMRMLTTEELHAVVGGPEIKNGDQQIVQVAPTAALGG